MSHLLRRPAIVPALFSGGIEAPRLSPRRTGRLRPRTETRIAMILPTLLLVIELPFIRGATDLLRFALPH